MPTSRSRSAAIVAGASLLLLAGSAAAQGVPAPKRGGQVIVGFTMEPQSLNPIFYAIEVSMGVQMAIFDNLWKIDEKGAWVPNLATQVPTVGNGGISADGRTYTIHLRKDVKWHDGRPFTADDVKFTWETIMNPKVLAQSRIGLDQVVKCEVLDAATIRMMLNVPYAPFVARWSEIFVVPKHVLEKSADINKDPFNTTRPVGTGPFKFVEWRAGSTIVLEANRAYHGPGPYLDRLIFKIVPDSAAFFAQFKTGEIDVTGHLGILAEFVPEAKRLPDRDIHLFSTWSTERLEVNELRPFLADKRVRRALSLAIDRRAIIDGIYGGLHVASATYIPPASPWYNPHVKPDPYDPERAKRLLDEAGWTIGPDGIRRNRDGVRAEVTLSAETGNRPREQSQVLIQEMFRKVGVSAKISNAAAAEVFGEYRTKSKFDLLQAAGVTAVGPDPESTYRFHTKASPPLGGRGSNFSAYSSKAADQLLDQGKVSTNPADRLAIYRKLQEVMVDEVPAIQLFHRVVVEGTRHGLMNYKPNPNVRSSEWNVNEWWWNR